MIYLDNAATTLVKPPEVERAVCDAMRTCGNAGRGGHSAAMYASDVLFECRMAACALFGAENLLGLERLWIVVQGRTDVLAPGSTTAARPSVFRLFMSLSAPWESGSYFGCSRW